VVANPALAAPVLCPGGANIKPPFEMGVANLIETVEYDYPTFHLSMDCFWCEVVEGQLKLLEAKEARWLSKEALHSVQWLPADLKLIEKIEKHMNMTPNMTDKLNMN
jgi:8-oxo-dGTP diphosphatase